MDLENYRKHCVAKKSVTEEFPFDENVLVFKVHGKIFALADINNFTSVNLKVEPEVGVELREQYEAVKPGYHMNKKHWITVEMDGTVPDRLLKQWIDNSYQLVVKGLPKAVRDKLNC